MVSIAADREGSTRVVDCAVHKLLRQMAKDSSAKDLCFDPW